jgi:hypothetical protein
MEIAKNPQGGFGVEGKTPRLRGVCKIAVSKNKSKKAIAVLSWFRRAALWVREWIRRV